MFRLMLVPVALSALLIPALAQISAWAEAHLPADGSC